MNAMKPKARLNFIYPFCIDCMHNRFSLILISAENFYLILIHCQVKANMTTHWIWHPVGHYLLKNHYISKLRLKIIRERFRFRIVEGGQLTPGPEGPRGSTFGRWGGARARRRTSGLQQTPIYEGGTPSRCVTRRCGISALKEIKDEGISVSVSRPSSRVGLPVCTVFTSCDVKKESRDFDGP
jgi:hypothetical protein